jgi:hypothetical protein
MLFNDQRRGCRSDGNRILVFFRLPFEAFLLGILFQTTLAELLSEIFLLVLLFQEGVGRTTFLNIFVGSTFLKGIGRTTL